MQAAIGYLRVSTREQGRSGLGLAAQRLISRRLGKRGGFTVKSCIRTCRPAPERTRYCCDRGLRRD